MDFEIVKKIFVTNVLILSIISLPFCLITLVVLGYYIRRRYRLYQEIKRIPHELLMKQSYQNHRKNLKIKATISNFIIIILLQEFFDNLSFIFYLLPNWVATFEKKNADKFIFLFFAHYYIEKYIFILRLSLIPMLSLMMDFLWLAYRKYEYRCTVIRWIVYILMRAIIIWVLNHVEFSTNETIDSYQFLISWFTNYLIIFFYILDFIQFVYFSRKFYLHLKSREKEIRLFYFDKQAYLESKFIRIHFKIATILVVLALFFFTLGFAMWSFLGSLTFITRVFQISNYIDTVSTFLYAFIAIPSVILYKVMISLNYLYIFIVIIYKFFRDRHRLKYINNKIRPIIDEYHNTFYNTRY